MEATKSLDAILNRKDYKRLTEQLKERVSEIAKLIREKMEELDLQTLELNHIELAICSEGYDWRTYYYLAISYDKYTNASLEDLGQTIHLEKDCPCEINGANNNLGLIFLNHAKDFIEKLGEIEDHKVAAVSKALSETQDL